MGGFFILVIIPVAVLDSIFYLWTFMSLYDVVAQLEHRRQTEKLQLYRKFIWVLGTCLALSCVWVVYQMYFLYANLFPSLWQLAWLFDAYWYTLAFAILCAIMYLWAPNENSKKYAYYEQNINLEDGEDGRGVAEEAGARRPGARPDGLHCTFYSCLMRGNNGDEEAARAAALVPGLPPEAALERRL